MSRLVFTVVSENPQQLKNYLRDSCGVSAGLIRKLKNQKGIAVNGKFARTVDMVKNGDIITLEQTDNSEIEPNPLLQVPIIFENEDLVVFNKPSGMPVHPSIRHRTDTLGNFFAARYGKLAFRPVNRLDKDTSGLCLVAKNSHSANILQGTAHKIYYAAVQGITEPQGTIDAPIARENESIIIRCIREDGKRAVTHYKKIREGNGFSLLEIDLETGRTHQIRVHFSHFGYPLAGDDLYGGSLEKITRQALHCGKMSFKLPMTNEEITVEAPIPQDIEELFTKKGNIMEKIASFQVDHTKFGVGMYISRIDGDIITYDVRMVKPNGGTYISNPSLHTIEHLFATYARNSQYSDSIIYVGPMGCRTGFYLLTRDNMTGEQAISLVKSAYAFIAKFDGVIPGLSEIECGNYLEHDLNSAKKDVLPLLERLENYTEEMLNYEYHF